MRIRKLVCAGLAVLALSAAANAEVHPHAIGIRVSSGGGEINYQRASALFGSDRLEIGAYISFDPDHLNLYATAVPQWYWNISRSAARGGFNWYLGPGAGAGVSTWKEPVYDAYGNRIDYDSKSRMYLGIGGQIGIEYDFNAIGAPLNLSLDTRPMINLFHMSFSVADIFYGISLGIRFTF
jgi:hypothetical protein